MKAGRHTLLLLLLLAVVRCSPADSGGEEVFRLSGTVGESEERFGRWVERLEELPTREAAERVRELFRQEEGSPERFLLLGELCEKYFYSPDSPWRDDELYLAALEQIVESPHLDDYRKLRPRYQLNMAQRNRPGLPAADFSFADERGAAGRLSQIEAPFTLLVFADPDCTECRTLLRRLRRNGWIRLAERSLGLRIVVIYSSPEERREQWSEYAATLPERWIAGCDEGARLHYEGLYDLRAVPSLYLLDAEKRVLCKGETQLRPVAKRLRREIFRPREGYGI